MTTTDDQKTINQQTLTAESVAAIYPEMSRQMFSDALEAELLP